MTGPLNDDGTLLYQLVGLGRDSDMQVEHAFDERQLFAPSLTWLLGEDTSLTAYVEYQLTENGFSPYASYAESFEAVAGVD